MAFEPFLIKGLDDLEESLNGADDRLEDPVIWAKAGTYLKAKILERTGKGESYKGGAFEPYSPKYAATRAKKGLPIAQVDLFFNGAMLAALTFEESFGSVRLFFLDTDDQSGTSNAAKAYFNQISREFFGWSETDEETLPELINEWLLEYFEGYED